jgi:hypothetical protein
MYTDYSDQMRYVVRSLWTGERMCRPTTDRCVVDALKSDCDREGIATAIDEIPPPPPPICINPLES